MLAVTTEFRRARREIDPCASVQLTNGGQIGNRKLSQEESQPRPHFGSGQPWVRPLEARAFRVDWFGLYASGGRFIWLKHNIVGPRAANTIEAG